jgi:hypothetical protein
MRSMVPASISAGIAAALLLGHASASAATVDFTGYVHGSETVNFSVPHPPGPNKTGSPGAGGFATILNGGPSFETYCIDLFQTINFADPAYNHYSIVPASLHTFANSNAVLDLGRLFAAGHLVNNSKTEAAFQIAIWEIAYETSGTYDLNGGVATFSGGTANTSGALGLATTWLGSLGSGPGVALTVLENGEHQDVIFAPVPEPETYALMLAGLGVMGMLAKKRKRTGRFA